MADDNGIRHFIITRFNLPWSSFGIGKESMRDSVIGLDIDYLEERFRLFERYTIPSMEAQTCKNFTWLVLFDGRTPYPFKERVSSYSDSYSYFEAVYAGAGFRLGDYVNELIETSGRTSAGVPRPVLTSRMDNDDAILPDYVELLQRKAAKLSGRDVYLTSPVYYQYDEREGTLTTRRLKKNHFISRLGNVFEVNQNHLPVNPLKYVRVSGIHSIEIIHGSNVTNSAKYAPGCVVGRAKYEKIGSLYGLKLMEYDKYKELCKKNIKENLPSTVRYNLGKVPVVTRKLLHLK